VAELTVPVTTLDQFFEGRSDLPHCILVDVEGFEFEALAGASRLIDECGDKLLLVVEVHPGLWPSAGTDIESVREWLSRHRKRAVPLTGQKDPLADHGTVVLEPV
jgi:hypothetical protein